MENKLFLGIGREIITPPVGCRLYGYSPDIFSDSLHDDLTLTAFYLQQGDTQALLISATLCLIQSELCHKILTMIEQAHGIPTRNCILHATHTHSGPNAVGAFGWGDIDRAYCDDVLIPAAMKAVKEALRAPVAVRLAIKQGESLVGINRRQLTLENKVILGQNPWGPFDPRMTILSFVDDKNNSIANMIHYGCHGTASGKNTQISRDWSGVMTDAVEQKTGGITAFFNGPEGDVGPRLANGKTVGEDHVKYALELGDVAAQDALRICHRTADTQNAALSVSHRVLQIPLAPRIPLAVAEEEIEKFRGQRSNLKAKRLHHYERIIASYAEGYKDAPTLSVPQTVIRIGAVAFVSFSLELFSEIGMRIAQASPYPYTLSLSNANGSDGYFITEEQIVRGGYEVGMYETANLQPYAKHADHSVVLQTLAHLKGE